MLRVGPLAYLRRAGCAPTTPQCLLQTQRQLACSAGSGARVHRRCVVARDADLSQCQRVMGRVPRVNAAGVGGRYSAGPLGVTALGVIGRRMSSSGRVIARSDYSQPSYRADYVQLSINLAPSVTIVTCRQLISRGDGVSTDTPLFLNGKHLKLHSVRAASVDVEAEGGDPSSTNVSYGASSEVLSICSL